MCIIRRKAFTLIELLVVISIISILASMILPSLSHVRRKANMTKDRSNISGIAQALAFYADEHNGLMPRESTPVKSIKMLIVKGYIPDPKIFECPAMQPLSKDQLLESSDKNPDSNMHNQYYYSWRQWNRSDNPISFCLGDAPNAWRNTPNPLAIVAKCDGTTMELKLEDDPAGAKSMQELHHPYQIDDKIYYPDSVKKGEMDTCIEQASSTTTWFN